MLISVGLVNSCLHLAHGLLSMDVIHKKTSL